MGAYTVLGRYEIHGIDFLGGQFQNVVDFIEEAHNDRAACLIGFAPMTSIADAIIDTTYKDILNQFDVICMDGASVVKMVKGNHYWTPERCSGPDVMAEIIRRTAYSKTRHFLYGTSKETLAKLKENLESEGALIVGTMAPPFLPASEWERREWKDPDMCRAVQETKADYVWVALGAPKQERLCAASKTELPGVKLMAVGAAFNFLSGTVKRAPVSWQKAGFEWLWRILHEPKQFFRYVKSAIVCFVTRDR